MRKYISFGYFKSSFKYLFFFIFFQLINDILYGHNHNESFKIAKLFNDPVQNSLSKHRILHSTFSYLGTSILAFIYYRYEKNTYGTQLTEYESKKDKRHSRITLLHYDGVKDFKTKKSLFIFLIIIFLWIFQEQLVNLFMHSLKDLDFWMVEILIISIISSKMFNHEIYKHQWLAIILNIIPCIFKISAISLSFLYENSEDQKYQGNLPILYTIHKIYIPFGVIAFLSLVIIRSYVNSKLKWFMDLQYISSNKLLMIYGLMGTIICCTICIITTFYKCSMYEGSIDDTINLENYICQVENKTIIDNKNYTYLYLDNFFIYFQFLKDIEIIKELIVIFIGILSFYFSKYFTILAIKYLTPVHIVFTTPIYFFFKKLVLIFITLVWEHVFFTVDDIIKRYKFFLDISGDISSFLGFLIYLEIIILNFNKYNYNINLNITRRSLIDSYGLYDTQNDKSDFNDDESEATEISELNH